jgi:RNA polymerase sigma factor (sigma-70 family)
MMPKKVTENEIVLQLKNGNDSYLQYLYAYLPEVRRYMLNNNGDEDDAKDSLQEAIIVLYKNIQAGKYNHTNLKGYIMTIVKNQWLDLLKKRKTQQDKLFVEEEAEEPQVIEIGKPKISLRQYLQDAINKLGDPCKSILIATIFFKKRMEQIAADFGYADAHSVRQQKLRCLKRLRGLVDPAFLINLS